MERFEYPVLLKAAEEGGFIVTCRDLPKPSSYLASGW
jgi:predicted RNase H-like HicB family nuclease